MSTSLNEAHHVNDPVTSHFNPELSLCSSIIVIRRRSQREIRKHSFWRSTLSAWVIIGLTVTSVVSTHYFSQTSERRFKSDRKRTVRKAVNFVRLWHSGTYLSRSSFPSACRRTNACLNQWIRKYATRCKICGKLQLSKSVLFFCIPSRQGCCVASVEHCCLSLMTLFFSSDRIPSNVNIILCRDIDFTVVFQPSTSRRHDDPAWPQDG